MIVTGSARMLLTSHGVDSQYVFADVILGSARIVSCERRTIRRTNAFCSILAPYPHLGLDGMAISSYGPT